MKLNRDFRELLESFAARDVRPDHLLSCPLAPQPPPGWLRGQRTGGLTADILVISVTGFVLGYTWGVHVADTGQRYQPRSIWVSLALAGVAGSVALYARRDLGWERRFAGVPQFLRFPVSRLAGVALLNLVLAVGIAVGFNA